MANWIRTGDPRGFNKGCRSKFCEGSRVRQTPGEGGHIDRKVVEMIKTLVRKPFMIKTSKIYPKMTNNLYHFLDVSDWKLIGRITGLPWIFLVIPAPLSYCLQVKKKKNEQSNKKRRFESRFGWVYLFNDIKPGTKVGYGGPYMEGKGKSSAHMG